MGNLGYNPTLDFQPPPEKIFGPPKNLPSKHLVPQEVLGRLGL